MRHFKVPEKSSILMIVVDKQKNANLSASHENPFLQGKSSFLKDIRRNGKKRKMLFRPHVCPSDSLKTQTLETSLMSF